METWAMIFYLCRQTNERALLEFSAPHNSDKLASQAVRPLAMSSSVVVAPYTGLPLPVLKHHFLEKSPTCGHETEIASTPRWQAHGFGLLIGAEHECLDMDDLVGMAPVEGDESERQPPGFEGHCWRALAVLFHQGIDWIRDLVKGLCSRAAPALPGAARRSAALRAAQSSAGQRSCPAQDDG